MTFQKFKNNIIQLQEDYKKIQEDNKKLSALVSTSAFLLEELSKISVDLQKSDLEASKTIKNIADFGIQLSKTLEDFQLSVYDAIRVIMEQMKGGSLVRTAPKSTSLTSLPGGKKNDKIKPN